MEMKSAILAAPRHQIKNRIQYLPQSRMRESKSLAPGERNEREIEENLAR